MKSEVEQREEDIRVIIELAGFEGDEFRAERAQLDSLSCMQASIVRLIISRIMQRGSVISMTEVGYGDI